MALIRKIPLDKLLFALVVSGVTVCMATDAGPFEPGFSMATIGTVIWGDGASGRQSWTAAALYDDTLCWGLSATAVSYYDAMDNFSDKTIGEGRAGGLLHFGIVTCKASGEYFNALDTYFEHTGFMSVGCAVARRATISADLTGTRISCAGIEEAVRTFAQGGITAVVRWRYAAVSLSVDRLTLKSAGPVGIEPALRIRAGVHTIRTRYGGQGVLFEITPSRSSPVRFCIGEEYRIHSSVGLQAGFANNPVGIGFGVVVELKRLGALVALIDHPVLGWSRGISFETAR